MLFACLKFAIVFCCLQFLALNGCYYVKGMEVGQVAFPYKNNIQLLCKDLVHLFTCRFVQIQFRRTSNTNSQCRSVRDASRVGEQQDSLESVLLFIGCFLALCPPAVCLLH